MRPQHGQWPETASKWPQQTGRQRKKHRECIQHFISLTVHERALLGIALRRSSLGVTHRGSDNHQCVLAPPSHARCAKTGD